MIIPHPLLGPRDAQEFRCLGDAALIDRPPGLGAEGAPVPPEAFHDYAFLRGNPRGVHRELWYHEYGDRSWLIVTRDTLTHAVLGAELAAAPWRKDGSP